MLLPKEKKDMENNHQDDDTLLARWLAGDLQPEDLEALRNLEGYPEYVELLQALEGMELPEYSPTLAWQKMQPLLEAEKAKKAAAEIAAAAAVPPAATEETDVSAETAAPAIADEPKPPLADVGPAAPVPAAPPKPAAKLVELAEPAAPKVPSLPEKARQPGTNWQRIAAIAAVVLVAAVGLWWMSGGPGEDQSIATKAGEQQEVKLPDGSVATLNALSSLDFSPKTWTDNRYLVLDGEAFFKAKKGKTFLVRTEQGSVEVVGTTFNVYARGEELEVKCIEGRVQVTNPEGTERVLLKKGEQVSVLRGYMQERHGLAFYPNWFKGETSFRGAPLDRVFGEIERQFGVMVLADSLGQRTFSGKFVHKDLKKALKMVCDPMKLQFEVKGDTVLVN